MGLNCTTYCIRYVVRVDATSVALDEVALGRFSVGSAGKVCPSLNLCELGFRPTPLSFSLAPSSFPISRNVDQTVERPRTV